MSFADRYEQQAHDIICLIKYGGFGGTVSTQQLRKVADYLRGGPLKRSTPPLPVLGLPKLPPLPPLPLPPLPAIATASKVIQ